MRSKPFYLLLCVSMFSLVSAQTIPLSRTVDWSRAGYQGTIPSYSNVINIGAFGGVGDGITDNSAALQNTIASLGGAAGVIYFPKGTYKFLSSITLPDSVIIRGAASDSTTLLFDLGGTLNNCFNVNGSDGGVIYRFVVSALRDSNQIQLDQNNALQTGDWLRIYQNDSSLVTSSWANGSVGQIVQVQSINGNQLTITESLRKDFLLSDSCKTVKIFPKKGIGFECIKIKRADATAQQTQNIDFNRAVNCWVKGIESDTANFAHIALSYCSNITITESYFHHAFAYGGSGQGYGVVAQFATGECLVVNNIFKHLRHSMLLQAGSNGNVFAYNYSLDPFWMQSPFPANAAGDIVLHGNYPFCNLFEGNIVQNITIDDSHGKNGPYNTFFRNRGELYGIVMNNNPATDDQNFVGNEVSNNSQGLYLLSGTGHFEYGNNIKGTITPTGTTNLPDSSYYLEAKPDFFTGAWPSVGVPVVINTGTIPAKDHQQDGQFTSCSSVSAGIAENFCRVVAAPNPAHEVFEMRDCNEPVIKFEMYESDGRKVLEGISAGKISLAGLSAGIYCIRIWTFSGRTTITKIVVI